MSIQTNIGIDAEVKDLSIRFNREILELEKKYNNEFKILVAIPQMFYGSNDNEDFKDEPKVKLQIAFP